MAASQILLLIDVDQSAPLRQLDDNEEDDSKADEWIESLKRASIRLVAEKCRRETSRRPKFAFRFYSSTGFYSTWTKKSAEKSQFCDFTANAVDDFESALNAEFEKRLKTRSGLDQHLRKRKQNCGCEADSVRRALENVSLTLEWDTPDLDFHDVKSGDVENVIVVFTKFPSAKTEFDAFFTASSSKVTP